LPIAGIEPSSSIKIASPPSASVFGDAGLRSRRWSYLGDFRQPEQIVRASGE
jgi:hypothetical protein